jgi:hypothetical protein
MDWFLYCGSWLVFVGGVGGNGGCGAGGEKTQALYAHMNNKKIKIKKIIK